MPTFKLNGNLVHFAAWKDHIGFYATPSTINEFKKELPQYEGSKRTIESSIDNPIPFDLIQRITKQVKLWKGDSVTPFLSS